MGPHVLFRFLLRVAASALLLTNWPVAAQSAAADTVVRRVVPATPPAGVDIPDVEWGAVSIPDIGLVQVAIARPAGSGPFPAVILLHGTHGFAREYMRLARDLARGGVIAVAACWFAPGSGAGSRFITPIACSSGAPRIAAAASPQVMETIDVLVRAVQTLPGVRPDRIALFGHSRGGGAALNYVLRRGSVQAAMLNSAGYPVALSENLPSSSAPILILHGEADRPDDGGSEFTDVRMARAFEAALLRAGQPVESAYYPAGRHNSLFMDPAQYEAETRRMRAFLRRHLLD